MAKSKKKNPKKQKRPVTDIQTEAPVSSINENLFCQEMNIMQRIANPHEHMDGGLNIYGTNSIPKLLMDTGYDKSKWPTPGISGIQFRRTDISNLKPEQLALAYGYYENLSKTLIRDYANVLFSNPEYGFLTFDELRKLPCCNIMKMYTSQQHPLFPKIPPIATEPSEDSELPLYTKYGWNIFIPMLNEFVIRVAAHRYLHVKVAEINKEQRYYIAQFTVYLGTHAEYIPQNRCIIKCTFDKHLIIDEDKSLAMECTCIQAIPYEQIMTMGLDSVNFSPKEKNFWYDLFGIGPFEEGVIVTAKRFDPEINDFEADERFLICQQKADLEKIQRLKYVKIVSISPHKDMVGQTESNLLVKMASDVMNILFFINQSILGKDEGKAAQKGLREIVKTHNGVFTAGACTFSSKAPMFIRIPTKEDDFA